MPLRSVESTLYNTQLRSSHHFPDYMPSTRGALKSLTNLKPPKYPPGEAKAIICFHTQIPKVMARLSLRPSMHLTLLGLLCNHKTLPGARIRGQTPIPTLINPRPNSMRLTQICQVPHIIQPCNPISKGITPTCINNLHYHHILCISCYLHLLTHHLPRHLLP